jgi:hypothetical protein
MYTVATKYNMEISTEKQKFKPFKGKNLYHVEYV